MNTLNFYTIFVLDGFNAIFIFTLIMLTIFKHRVFGLTLWLLVGLEISVVFWVAANILPFIAIKQLEKT